MNHDRSLNLARMLFSKKKYQAAALAYQRTTFSRLSAADKKQSMYAHKVLWHRIKRDGSFEEMVRAHEKTGLGVDHLKKFIPIYAKEKLKNGDFWNAFKAFKAIKEHYVACDLASRLLKTETDLTKRKELERFLGSTRSVLNKNEFFN